MGSTLTLRLPESLHRSLKQQAKADGISLNQFLVTAAAEKLSALMTCDYLEKEAAKGRREDFLNVLNNVPHVKPENHDKI